jgi:hypothetical protein
MMTTTTPSHGNPFHHLNAATSRGDAPQTTSCPHPEWMPLDGIAQTWAGFGSEANSPAAFQATGLAFLALAFEASALRHYPSSVGSTEGEGSPSLAYTQGIEHAIADLDGASQQWKSVLLWLDHLAREAPTSVKLLASLVLEQQQRVLSLILRVQREYLDAHHEPLLIYLGHLPAPAEAKAGLP